MFLNDPITHPGHITGDPKVMTKEEVAMGFIVVANEAMCRPIRDTTF